MNIRQLEVFRAVMTHGSVTEAARSLNVSQPSVSSVLRHAEQTLGVRLFKRSGGRLRPTMEADLLFPEVEQVYEQLSRVEQFVRDLRTGGSGHLSIVVNPTLARNLLPQAIARFRESFPQVRIRLQTDLPAVQIPDRILAREFDLGFAYGPSLNLHIGSVTLARSRLVVALPRDHRLTRQASIRAEDLAGEPIISFGVGAPLRSLAEAVFADARQQFNPVIAASFSSAACALAQQGVGLAIVDQLILMTEQFPTLTFRPLLTKREVELNLLYAGSQPRSMLSERFAGILRIVAADYERVFSASAARAGSGQLRDSGGQQQL